MIFRIAIRIILIRTLCIAQETTSEKLNRGIALGQFHTVRIFQVIACLIGLFIWVLTGPLVFAQQENFVKLNREQVKSVTGIEWTRVKLDKAHRQVKVLSRKHPFSTGVKGTVAEHLSKVAKPRAKEIAAAFVERNKVILGLDENSESRLITFASYLYPPKYSDRGSDFVIVFQQNYKNIPVFEGTCRVVMDNFGRIYKVKNQFVSSIRAPVEPVLTGEEARERAKMLLGTNIDPAAAPRLVIFGKEHLGWHMNFEKPVFREVIVNDISEELLLNRPNIVTPPKK